MGKRRHNVHASQGAEYWMGLLAGYCILFFGVFFGVRFLIRRGPDASSLRVPLRRGLDDWWCEVMEPIGNKGVRRERALRHAKLMKRAGYAPGQVATLIEEETVAPRTKHAYTKCVVVFLYFCEVHKVTLQGPNDVNHA